MPTVLLDRRIRGLPRRSQGTSYRTGDARAISAGTQPYGTRAAEFLDLGNGTIFDRATGLQWVKQPELIIPGATGIHAANQIQAARGNWANSTAYALADLAVDTANTSYWVCCVAHTSPAAGTTFAQHRAANPTYWRQTVWTASAANLTTPASMTWNNAIDNSAALTYAGFDDWLLPSLMEMLSLHVGVSNTVFQLGSVVKASTYYWTADTRMNATGYAHVLGYAVTPDISYADKTSARLVLPVRGGRI